MFRNFGWPEILLIAFVVLLLFGVGKLPQVGAALGKGIRSFRKGQSGDLDNEEDEEEKEPKPEKKKTTKKS